MTREQLLRSAAAATADECIMWPFAVRASNGYGAHSHRENGPKVNVDTHVRVCEIRHGPRPSPDHEAAHSCGRKLCISGPHLRWALRVVNMADAKAHGTLRGGGRHRQRFFAPQIAEIAASPDSTLILARRFETTPTYISKLRRQSRQAA